MSLRSCHHQTGCSLMCVVCVQAVRVDHVCVLVPLRVEAGLWSLVPGEQTLLKQPLSWMVRRTNLEYFPRGRSYWDRYTHTHTHIHTGTYTQVHPYTHTQVHT